MLLFYWMAIRLEDQSRSTSWTIEYLFDTLIAIVRKDKPASLFDEFRIVIFAKIKTVYKYLDFDYSSLIANFVLYYVLFMRIHALKTLKLFWQKYPDSEASLRNWYSKIESKLYSTPQEVVADFNGADYVGNERIIFNISGNKYRLVVAFNYAFQLCFVKFIGTHKEYDNIDPKLIEFTS